MTGKEQFVTDPTLIARYEVIGRYVCSTDDDVGTTFVEINVDNVTAGVFYEVVGRIIARTVASLCAQGDIDPDSSSGPDVWLDTLVYGCVRAARAQLHGEIVGFRGQEADFKTI